jgi:hypothetical protein
MYSHKVLLLILATIVIAGCQTKPVKYEVETVVRPMPMPETGPNGESIVTRPQILTMVGKHAEITTEELYTNQLPGRISCTALVQHENDGNKVDTSISIIKKGKEVCFIKQSTTLPQ